jgi:hypothetical protein
VSVIQLSKLSELVRHIGQQAESHAPPDVLMLVRSLQEVMQQASRRKKLDADAFALLRVHGIALLALLRGAADAPLLLRRALDMSEEILNKRAKMGEQSTKGDGTAKPH